MGGGVGCVCVGRGRPAAWHTLTTPPCSEGVTWVMPGKVITASQAQLARLGRALLESGVVVLTERPTQPLNGRKVLSNGA